MTAIDFTDLPKRNKAYAGANGNKISVIYKSYDKLNSNNIIRYPLMLMCDIIALLLAIGGETMGLLPDIGYPQTGEVSDSGTYACMNCPHDKETDKAIIILNKREKLPKCLECGQPTYWMKI